MYFWTTMAQKKTYFGMARRLTNPGVKAPEFKAILLGEAGVGKTCLFRRFIGQSFPSGTKTTVASQASDKKVYETDDGDIQVTYWDTAGMERLASLTETYYRNTNVAIILFDVTRRDTFDRVIFWVENIQERRHNKDPTKDIKIILVMNKIDLRTSTGSDTDFVTSSEVMKFIENHQNGSKIQALYEVSAKTMEGVDELQSFVVKCLSEERRTYATMDRDIKSLKLDNDYRSPKFSLKAWVKKSCGF
ncbi:ras-related protein RABF1 isoform X2 [Lingula anatina]|uniref:Ras-related protein RABF1 isoform X2 n=1 Tax=Lingula anatina TaxID=7574 RepID=A0A1S3JB59_LINAN|nr:ras-related protein RABF1 isoform X2 [Lingula anatina]|eukprot:XP_013407563.1 ras-related protein RABF1 isoform X2 [Lingula anatina]